MIRQTSIDVYHQIEEEGLLSKIRMLVYRTLWHHGPLSCNELCHEQLPDMDKVCLSPAFAVLERIGCIAHVDTRPCRITGRNVMIWDVTNKLPKTKDEEKRAVILKKIAKHRRSITTLLKLLERMDKRAFEARQFKLFEE